MSNKKSNLAINMIFSIVIAVVSIGIFILFIYNMYPSFMKQIYCSTVDKVSILNLGHSSLMCKYPSATSSIIVLPDNTTEINTTASGAQIIDIPPSPKIKSINITVYGINSLLNAKIIINNTNSHLAILTVVPPFGNKKTFDVNPKSFPQKEQYFDITNMITESAYNICTQFPCNITLNFTSQKKPSEHLKFDLIMKLNITQYNCSVMDSVAAALIDCGKLSDFGLNPKNITCSYLMFSSKCPMPNLNVSTINATINKYGMNTRFTIGDCSSNNNKIYINLSNNLNLKTGLLVSYNASSKQMILS